MGDILYEFLIFLVCTTCSAQFDLVILILLGDSLYYKLDAHSRVKRF